MKILVLGATGGCGRWFVRLAATRGHTVTAAVRTSSTGPPHSNVTYRETDVLASNDLQAALGEHDALVSCLGLRRAGRSPFAKLESPPDLTSRAISGVVQHASPDYRVVAISAAGVGGSSAALSWPVRRLVRTGNIGVAYQDLEAMEALLRHSPVDWLVVRPVTLVDGPPRGRTRVVNRYGLLSTVRRGDVAAYMLDALERDSPLGRRALMIAG